MAQIDIPIPAANATVDAQIQDASGNAPPNVINENDDWRIRIEVNSDGLLFDIATLTWKFVLYAEGYGGSASEISLTPVTIDHAGSHGGSPYSDTVDLNVMAGQLPVPAAEDAAVYELALAVVAIVGGEAAGMAGLINLGNLMILSRD